MLNRLFFLCLLLPTYVWSQTKCPTVNHKGLVVLNTKEGNGISGVSIMINGSTGPITGQGGNFFYKLTNCPGTRVRVQATKEGYAVVNHIDFVNHKIVSDLSGAEPQFLIIMCKEKDLNKYRIQYYTSLTGISFDAETQRLQGRIEQLTIEAKNRNNQKSEELILLQKRHKDLLVERHNLQKYESIARSFANVSINEIDNNYLKAFDLYKEGQLREAQELLSISQMENKQKDYMQIEKLISILADDVRKKRNSWINSAILKGNIYYGQAVYDSTEYWYKRAVLEDTTNYENIFMLAYFLQRQNQNFMECEKWYIRASKLVKEYDDAIDIYTNLGNLYLHNKNLTSAEESYLKAYRMSDSLKNEELRLEAKCFILRNLGNYYFARHDELKTEECYIKSLKYAEQLVQLDSAKYSRQLAGSYIGMGFFLFKIKRAFVEAEPFYQKGIILLQRLHKSSPEPSQYPHALNLYANYLFNMGEKYNELEKIDMAYKIHSESYKLYQPLAKRNISKYGLDFANAIINLGVCEKFYGRVESAKSLYNEALSLLDSAAYYNHEQYDIEVARLYTDIILLNQQSRQLAEADKLFKHILSKWEELYAKEPEQYGEYMAEFLSSRQKYYLMTQDTQNEINILRRLISIYENLESKGVKRIMGELNKSRHRMEVLLSSEKK